MFSLRRLSISLWSFNLYALWKLWTRLSSFPHLGMLPFQWLFWNHPSFPRNTAKITLVVEYHHLQRKGEWSHGLSSFTAVGIAPGLVSKRASISGSKRRINRREEETDPLITFLATVRRRAHSNWRNSMGKKKERPGRTPQFLCCVTVFHSAQNQILLTPYHLIYDTYHWWVNADKKTTA